MKIQPNLPGKSPDVVEVQADRGADTLKIKIPWPDQQTTASNEPKAKRLKAEAFEGV